MDYYLTSLQKKYKENSLLVQQGGGKREKKEGEEGGREGKGKEGIFHYGVCIKAYRIGLQLGY